MKRLFSVIYSVFVLFAFLSCDDDLKVENTLHQNFNILWKEIDEKYCFFEYKKDSIKDWNEVYQEYYPKAMKCTTDEELFYVCGDMLKELKDGHVNLRSTFDVSRYDIENGHKSGYSSDLLWQSTNYLRDSCRRCGGFYYRLFEEGSVGYAFYPDFSNSFSEANLDRILYYFKDTKGLIIDVRGNGGGYLSLVDRLVSRFVFEKTLIGYRQYKTGKGHNDFSKPQSVYVEPSKNIKYPNLVVVLTDRGCYSSTNEFVQAMKGLPNVLIIGDQTGGGAGMPVYSELPCGWSFRMSANPSFDKNMNITEFGIQPDIKVIFDRNLAFYEEKDNIISTAIDLIKNAK